MNFHSCSFLVDENIHPEVIRHLHTTGIKAISVKDVGLNGKSDLEILSLAIQKNQVVLTQDADFGKLVYTSEIKFPGIVYLRPGHRSPSFHIQTLNAIMTERLDLMSPFILIGENKGNSVKIRLRNFLNE
jgi:predicted nuclease of predicted toxin-antitoxin system